jgi:hypothetical protein
MAAIPKFKAALLIDVGDVLFPQLADLITVRLKSFTKCQLEIETQIVAFLAQITQSTAATKDPLTVAAKRRAHQQGFLEHYLERCATIEYKVEPEMDMLGENCQQIANTDLLQVATADPTVRLSVTDDAGAAPNTSRARIPVELISGIGEATPKASHSQRGFQRDMLGVKVALPQLSSCAVTIERDCD